MKDVLNVYFGRRSFGDEKVVVCYVFNRASAQHYSFSTDEMRTTVMNALKKRYKEGGIEFSNSAPDEFMSDREKVKDLDAKVLNDLRSEVKGTHL